MSRSITIHNCGQCSLMKEDSCTHMSLKEDTPLVLTEIHFKIPDWCPLEDPEHSEKIRRWETSAERISEALEKLELAINATPTSTGREHLTVANIHAMAALEYIKEAAIKEAKS